MTRLGDQKDLIAKVAQKNDVPVELIEELLSLEEDFKNLHAYGAKSSFRQRINEAIDRSLTNKNKTV